MSTLFDQIALLIEREFYDATFLTQQWPQIKATLAAQYRTAISLAEQEAALNRLLQALHVSHAVLITPELATHIAQQVASPRNLQPMITTYGSVLLARIRSFKVRTTTLADIHQLAEACRTAQHLVLDLRVNDGGAGSVVVELASLVLPANTPVLRIRDRAGFTMRQPYRITSFPEAENLDHQQEVLAIKHHHYLEYRTKVAPEPLFRGNIVVVIDKTCYSCGEVFAQAMKEHAQATLVGTTTAGCVVAATDHQLANGYGVFIPFAEMRSGNNLVIEGKGVAPHLNADVTDLDDVALFDMLTNLNLLRLDSQTGKQKGAKG